MDKFNEWLKANYSCDVRTAEHCEFTVEDLLEAFRAGRAAATDPTEVAAIIERAGK
jgi:hypothetical protein